ncbi:MAG TPA: SAM-dependent methyltransferase [Pseudohongiella sp.]|nr:SAM-dependent methyltransferase [Pseudohongiella sp.]
MRQSAPSALRNREPICQVLKSFVKPGDKALEIAAGTGEHAIFFSHELPVAQWWPSDIKPEALSSIAEWREHQGIDALQPPLPLDISGEPAQTSAQLALAGLDPVALDLITCINMIHISPWPATQGLMRHAEALLNAGGILYLYVPYQRGGRHTADSNAAFDADLQSRNPQWGVRHLEDVVQLAGQHQLELVDTIEMPANNLSVIFRRN